MIPQDEQWFEVLAGRNPEGVDDDVKQEAAALRTAILKRHTALQNAPVDLAALQRFKQRLRDENLLPAKPKAYPKWMAMAAVLVVSVGLGLLLRQQFAQTDQVGETMRGEQNQHLVVVSDAQQASTQLKQDLLALGITPRIAGAGRIWRVEAYVPTERESAVNALLDRYHIKVGPDGQLLITFDSPHKK